MAIPADPRVDVVRRFNRFYTRRIGALRAGLLDEPVLARRGAAPLRARASRRSHGGRARPRPRPGRGVSQPHAARPRTAPPDQPGAVEVGRAAEPAQPYRRGAPDVLDAGHPLERRGPCDARPAVRARPAPPGRGDAGRRAACWERPSRRCRTSSARTGPATWAGSCTATARSTRGNTAGTSGSRRWSRRSSRSSSSTSTRSGSTAGSPSARARSSGRCSWCRSRLTVAQLRLLYVEPGARGLGIGTRPRRRMRALRARQGLQEDRPLDQQHPARRPPHLRDCGLSPRRRRAAPELRPSPGRADLGAEAVAGSPPLPGFSHRGNVGARRWRGSGAHPAGRTSRTI